MKSFRARCPAKLNLFLELFGRRPDGYHELATVMAPVDLADTLEVRPARRFALEVEGASLPGPNSVERAYRAVARRRRIPPVRARLLKRIPHGSGLGGASSDAAAMIEALDTLFDLGLDRFAVGAEVGSDVNFFLVRGPALCTGRGEEVAPLARARPLHAVIAWPGIVLSTRDVYRCASKGLTRRPRCVIDFINVYASGDRGRFASALFNRLEPAAFEVSPKLRTVMRRLRREPFEGVRMSGSGSAFYGLCGTRREAQQAAKRLERDLPGRIFAAKLT